jgi:hypothetical protein
MTARPSIERLAEDAPVAHAPGPRINLHPHRETWVSGPTRVTLCVDCGKYPADFPSKRCPGCEAYLEHCI